MIKVPSGHITVKGFDVSHYEPNTDFNKWKASGMDFCFLKATEGSGYVDASFHSFWKNSKAAGLIRGAYHFFHPKYDPIIQARQLAIVVGPLEPEDLPCVMDWETTDNVPSAMDRVAGMAFIQEVKRFTGKDPIIYGGPYFLQALALTPEFKNYPLWVAHYGTSAPLVPEPWKIWSFWQYSEAGVDYNLFNGSIDQLKRIARG